MNATITATPVLDDHFSPDHREAAVFEFQDDFGHNEQGVYLYDPECQPPLSFQMGDRVELHGFNEFNSAAGSLRLSHYTFVQTR